MNEAATRRVRELLALTERLLDVMARESEIINGRRPSAFAPIAEEKGRIAATYTRELTAAKAAPALLEGADPKLLNTLRDATEKLHETIEAQTRLLGRLRRVSEGLVKAIADEVAERRQPSLGYGPGASRERASSQPAIAIDSTV